MRLLSKREVTARCLYSPAHIARLEADGLFPQRVQIGQNRVGWVEQEVIDWITERANQRKKPTGNS